MMFPRWKNVSKLAQDFVLRLLEVDPTRRLSGAQSLRHLFLQNFIARHRRFSLSLGPCAEIPVLGKLKVGGRTIRFGRPAVCLF